MFYPAFNIYKAYFVRHKFLKISFTECRFVARFVWLFDLQEHRWEFREINSTHKDLLINLSSDFSIPYILFPFPHFAHL